MVRTSETVKIVRNLRLFVPVFGLLNAWKILIFCDLLCQIGMIAANDGLVLHNHIYRILKNHFRGKSYYVDLLDLFNEVKLSMHWPISFHHNLLAVIDINDAYAGGIPNSFRTDDRFNYHNWRRERSLKVLIAAVSEKLWDVCDFYYGITCCLCITCGRKSYGLW